MVGRPVTGTSVTQGSQSTALGTRGQGVKGQEARSGCQGLNPRRQEVGGSAADPDAASPPTCSSAPWRGPTNQTVPQVLRAGVERAGSLRVLRAEFGAPGIPRALFSLPSPVLAPAAARSLPDSSVRSSPSTGCWSKATSRGSHPDGKSSPGIWPCRPPDGLAWALGPTQPRLTITEGLLVKCGTRVFPLFPPLSLFPVVFSLHQLRLESR